MRLISLVLGIVLAVSLLAAPSLTYPTQWESTLTKRSHWEHGGKLPPHYYWCKCINMSPGDREWCNANKKVGTDGVRKAYHEDDAHKCKGNTLMT